MPSARFITRLLPTALLPMGTATAAETPPTSELAASIGQMLFGLAIVIAVLLACLWVIKRLSAPRGSATALKVLGAVPVGSRERVVLVALGSKVLALGVTPGSVRTLHVMEASEWPDNTAVPAIPSGKQFTDWLKQSLERKP